MRCGRRVGIRACRGVVDKDFGSFVLLILALFFVNRDSLTLAGLGAELLLLGGANVSPSISARGCRFRDATLDGGGGKSGSGSAVSASTTSRCGVTSAGGADTEALGVGDSFRLREPLRGVDSSFGRKSSRS